MDKEHSVAYNYINKQDIKENLTMILLLSLAVSDKKKLNIVVAECETNDCCNCP